MSQQSRRRVLSWAFYDWANSAFATTVMAGFFPIFFKQYWAGGLSATESTFVLGNASSLASLVVVALAPLIGAIADRGGVKKRFLVFFAAMGIVMTGTLFLVAEGDWAMAVTLYSLALIGFAGGNVFYDALLVEVAGESRVDRVSALGFALGYLGGGLLFAFDVLMTLHPGWFGLASAAEAGRWSFLTVAIWWTVFSIPVMLFVHEKREAERPGLVETVRAGMRQLGSTLGKIRTLRVTFLFLLAYWLYIDGVDTIVRMAVDYGLSIGFEANNLMLALLITQFVGFPAAIVFGRLGERWGAKRGILVAIAIYLLVISWAYGMSSIWEFYALAAAIGLVQGGIQALSRSLYTRLIPRDQAGEFFGFYNMLGKFAAVLGPMIMGWVGVATGSSRLSILSVAVLFIAGGLLLAFVDEEKGLRMARSLEKPVD
ncbi:MAG: MFS transporter [Pseudomonadota bacterium]|nr:MFS transporter [Pseudomonadota bacterium]